jgi:hypothetical protein
MNDAKKWAAEGIRLHALQLKEIAEAIECWAESGDASAHHIMESLESRGQECLSACKVLARIFNKGLP